MSESSNEPRKQLKAILPKGKRTSSPSSPSSSPSLPREQPSLPSLLPSRESPQTPGMYHGRQADFTFANTSSGLELQDTTDDDVQITEPFLPPSSPS